MSEAPTKKSDSPAETEGEYICQCFQVTDETIKTVIREGNLTTIEQITEACGAGGGCQSCHMLLDLFLDQHNKKNQPPEPEPAKKKKGFFSKLFSKA